MPVMVITDDAAITLNRLLFPTTGPIRRIPAQGGFSYLAMD
jgi:hypothetical protein